MDYQYRIGTLEDTILLKKLALNSFGSFKNVLTND